MKSGNPVSYYNGTRWSFGWANERQLTSAKATGNNITYTYDHNGLRTSKTVNGVKHTYVYASGRLLRESYGNVVLDFAYDANGQPYSMTYTNGTASPVTYYYITNLQGDVMYMVDAKGTIVAHYAYEPYGGIRYISGAMANINPLRYRGYYYDTETEFYYLQSRYYDPAICRFINADSYASTGQSLTGYNMFAYCGNNPMMCTDSAGSMWRGSCTANVCDGGSVDPYVKELVENKTELEVVYVNDDSGNSYATVTARIDSKEFDKWENDYERLKEYVRIYARYLHDRTIEKAEDTGPGAYWLTSENHIYSEMMAHWSSWHIFGIKSAEIADLNVNERRIEVLFIMENMYGYDASSDVCILIVE